MHQKFQPYIEMTNLTSKMRVGGEKWGRGSKKCGWGSQKP
jgi:hypothetical protein